ncbi:MAG: DUF2914 domain-containing protein [Parcubacteria group bacterium]|nr:DUF2914 domain-containing protein [Parcubacteria group bacterium]
MKSLFQKYKEFFKRNERYISGGALLFGFVIDNFTLTRIDLQFDNIVLFTYLIIALLAIVFINFYEEGILKNAFFERVRFISPLAMQFAFGGLFSGFVIFYTRSASLITSWPFILMLVILLIGNEFFKKKYTRFTFRMSIFFVALFSFLIFYVPVVTGSINAGMFVLSGVISLALMILIVRFLKFFIPTRIKKSKNALTWSITGIFILINVFYFTNIIPPIPLSLKEASAHYFIERTADNNYLAISEVEKWYDFLIPNNTIYVLSGEPVYVFSSVFAPTKLNTEIYHKWQYYDANADEWIESNRVGFNISGGRDGGYRGYTLKSNVPEGQWRVDVVTKRNQLLGRVKFEAVEVDREVDLEIQTL